MRQLELQPGDEFAVEGKGWLSAGINFFQKLWSKDGEAHDSHAGLILDSDGKTMEAIPQGTLGCQNFFEAYKGQGVMVVRYNYLTPELHEKALKALHKEFGGEGYPYYRIFLHIIPALARFHFLGKAVCSEVVAYYEWQVGARHRHWAGTNPDTLTDAWTVRQDYTIIFHGVLE